MTPLHPRWHPVLPVLPVATLLVLTALLAVPATRDAAQWLLSENRPIELLSFAFAFAGGVLGLVLAGRLRRRGEPAWVWGFYAVFALGLLVVAGEEVAWGQWFLGFETPEVIGAVNTQGEMTLHNYEGFNDHLEVFPLAFGLGGLVSLALGGTRWAPLASPRLLRGWYLVIAAMCAVDFAQDFYILHIDFDEVINGLDEAVEMLVAIAGFLYVVLNAERLDAPPPAPPADRFDLPLVVRPAPRQGPEVQTDGPASGPHGSEAVPA